MLANIRTLGWLFNPVTWNFCFDEPRDHVVVLVTEVENTPWHERHPYVVGPPGTYRCPKQLHVSPFLPMDLDYELSYDVPAEGVALSFKVFRGDGLLLFAGTALHRTALDTGGIQKLLMSYPAMPLRVSAAIYPQAVKLRRMGAPFFVYPKRSQQPSLVDHPSR